MHGAVYVLYVTTTLIIAVVCMAVSLTNSKRCIEVWSDVWSMLHDHKQSAEASADYLFGETASITYDTSSKE